MRPVLLQRIAGQNPLLATFGVATIVQNGLLNALDRAGPPSHPAPG